MDNAPCYGCPFHTATCHGSCEKYKQYAEQRAERIHDTALQNEVFAYRVDTSGRLYRYTGQGLYHKAGRH